MKIDLSGKKALVGGSSKGIGLGIAKQLAESGASVCLMARNESRLKQIVDQLPNSSNHSYLVVDFSNFNVPPVASLFVFSIVTTGSFDVDDSICKFVSGLLVPMPTYPEFNIVITMVSEPPLSTLNSIGSA